MSTMTGATLAGEIFDEMSFLSVDDLCRLCAVERTHMVELIDEGVLDVVQIDGRFSGAALRRARIALRLERDLHLNLAGVALALDLMEEVEQLRREIEARNP